MHFDEEIKIEARRLLTRRWFFKECGIGLGSLALASLMGKSHYAQSRSAITNPLAPKKPHFAPKAKRVIFLFQAGAPSQLEMFDYKPGLAKFNGKPCPPELLKGQILAFIKPDAALFATEFKFAKHGQSGAEMSEALAHLPKVADQITIIKSMMT